ncbi:type I DNA topoisomerase [Candidatus Microgenomates bacterium]|nr:type I DNA topoisomerase [Candidatus Microgenomates bacterium CPR3]RIK52084.1 MAG: type I DNA topoisomerase [Candidatus Microgenomates bacterium]
MDLVIVESPTKAKTLTRFLGNDYKIEASMGHVRDLPEKGGGLAIDVEHGFEPNYQVLSSKKKRVAELKALAKNAKVIYLATDPDREGEAISYHVQHLLSERGAKKEFKRVTFHEITKTAILEALSHPGVVNMDLVNAQQARRVLDRLVGYTLSPVLWKKVRRGLSAGRVQSVAVRLIVEKEKEITSFKPEEYWEIFANLKVTAKGELKVELVKIDGKTANIKNGEMAGKVVADLEGATYKVLNVSNEEQKSSPQPPFTTSLLQRAGSNMFGYSAKQTMQIAQSLYERGLITYHRTDSYNLATEAVVAARSYIEKNYGAEYLPAAPRVYKTKAASAQEAHEAIRPTNLKASPELEGRDKKLYELIRNRFLQCQMQDARYDKTTILVGAGNYELKADGKRMIFDGYMRLGKSTDDVFLPQVTSGEVLSLIKVEPIQKFTQPPARYSEAGLIKELEKRGIGRPSTYAAIISTIQDRGYVTKEEKRFHPTAVGIAVVEFLTTNFDNVMAYEFTARMESDLDAVADGKKKWVEVVSSFWTPMNETVKKVEETGSRVKVAVETTGEKCPKCSQGEVIIRTGKFGKFLSCDRYPECDYKAQYVEYAGTHLCPTCGGRVVIKKSRKGKFYGCEKYPECKWAAWRLEKSESNRQSENSVNQSVG